LLFCRDVRAGACIRCGVREKERRQCKHVIIIT
jgi:hypothetical protein